MLRRIALALTLAAALAPNTHADSPEERQFDLANRLFKRGFYDMAAEEYKAYLDKFPEGSQIEAAWYRLGESRYAAQEYEPALQAFDALLKRKPEGLTRFRALLRRGEINYHLKRFEDAKKELAPLTATEIEPAIRAGALFHLGKAQYDSNDIAGARDTLKTMLEALPGSPLAPYARYQLAFVYL